MLLTPDPDRTAAAALPEPASVRLGQGRRSDALSWMRAALAAAASFGVMAFVLGAGNRFTRGPWFLYSPDVSLMPPIGRAAWLQAFAVHQQSPLYALCGGYQVGGMESVTIYQFLYGWEWLRIASVILLVASLAVALVFFLRGVAKQHVSLSPLFALTAAAFVYVGLRYLADHAGLFATINLGQHRHALDITFAGVGLALLIGGAIAPPGAPRRPLLPRVAWGVAIALDIAFGALFEALDAGPLWTTFPGYAGRVLPAFDRLFAFHPFWRNFTENGYLIQACHRTLSIGLWAAALVALACALVRGAAWTRAAALFVFLTLDGVLGIATLHAGQPLVMSIVHQVVAIAVLAVAIMPREWRGVRSAFPAAASAVAA
jgi:heme a synthase